METYQSISVPKLCLGHPTEGKAENVRSDVHVESGQPKGELEAATTPGPLAQVVRAHP